MKYVQLIEVVDMSSGQWFTFWDLENQRQESLELSGRHDLPLGALFRFDRDAEVSSKVLEQIGAAALPEGVEPTFDLPDPQQEQKPMPTVGLVINYGEVVHG